MLLEGGGGRYLWEKTWAKVVGRGEDGESVNGLKEDFRPLVVGDGMSWVAVAITRNASPLVLGWCTAKQGRGESLFVGALAVSQAASPGGRSGERREGLAQG